MQQNHEKNEKEKHYLVELIISVETGKIEIINYGEVVASSETNNV